MIQTNKKPKILFVEDDRFFHLAYKYGLEKGGMEVLILEGSDNFFEQAHAFKPDLIILDFIIQPRNGLEILAALKQDQELKEVPVVIFSNLQQPSDIEKCLALGAVDYWVKTNVTRQETLARIKNILQRQ